MKGAAPADTYDIWSEGYIGADPLKFPSFLGKDADDPEAAWAKIEPQSDSCSGCRMPTLVTYNAVRLCLACAIQELSRRCGRSEDDLRLEADYGDGGRGAGPHDGSEAVGAEGDAGHGGDPV